MFFTGKPPQKHHKTCLRPINFFDLRSAQLSRLFPFLTFHITMPIPSSAPAGLTTTTPLPIICPACKDASSCPKHRCSKVLTKSCETVERELKTRASVEQPRRAPSLACRAADEQWVDISNQRLKSTQLGALYPGSKFKGVQKSGKTSYEVAVKIQVSRMLCNICEIPRFERAKDVVG